MQDQSAMVRQQDGGPLNVCGEIRFSEGLSTWSMTRTSTGPLAASSRRPGIVYGPRAMQTLHGFMDSRQRLAPIFLPHSLGPPQDHWPGIG
jgi:hypothetical protein